MRFFTNLRIKIRDFIKKHKNKVLLAFIAWLCIIAINYFLANWQTEEIPLTTYEPHEPIFETGQTVPEALQEEITQYIDEYIGYCNEKEYEKAYNMISQECRQAVYPTLESFKSYVNYVFKSPKIYNIQNYSNKNNKYIYRIRILDDILASGLTYQDSVKYFEDKFVIEKKNGQLTLSVKEYIDSKNLENVYEDNYIKIVVTKKVTMIEEEIYTLQITNRSGYYIVLEDGSGESEITMDTDKQTTTKLDGDYNYIILNPETSITKEIAFLNFYDEGEIAQTINFNYVRVLKNYTENEEENQKEDNIITTYGTSISVK